MHDGCKCVCSIAPYGTLCGAQFQPPATGARLLARWVCTANSCNTRAAGTHTGQLLQELDPAAQLRVCELLHHLNGALLVKAQECARLLCFVEGVPRDRLQSQRVPKHFAADHFGQCAAGFLNGDHGNTPWRCRGQWEDGDVIGAPFDDSKQPEVCGPLMCPQLNHGAAKHEAPPCAHPLADLTQ